MMVTVDTVNDEANATEEPGSGYAVAMQYGLPRPGLYVEIDLVPEHPVYGYALAEDACRLQQIFWYAFCGLADGEQANLLAYWDRLALNKGPVGFCVDPRADWQAACDGGQSCQGPIVRLSETAFLFVDVLGLMRTVEHVSHRVCHILHHARRLFYNGNSQDRLEKEAVWTAHMRGWQAGLDLEHLVPKKRP